MKALKSLILFKLMLLASFAHAGSFSSTCIGKDKSVAPATKTYTAPDGSTQETKEWLDWKAARPDWSASQNWDCCPQLVKDSAGVCTDPSGRDPAIKVCTAHGDCSGDQGCYQMREDDMFNADPSDPTSIDKMAKAQEEFDKKRGVILQFFGLEDPRPLGQNCHLDAECESYKCEASRCVESKICRLADLDEVAPGSIKCAEPFAKDGQQRCVNTSVDFYAGPVGKIMVVEKAGKEQCQFELVPTEKDAEGKPLSTEHLKKAIALAHVSSRSMEWLFSTTSNNNHEDCLFMMRWMRDGTQPLVQKRKDLLKAYNEDMQAIEKKFEEVKSAQKGDMTQVATSCKAGDSYEVTTKHDIALRRATGIDFLCYMKERNELLLEYEAAMKAWTAELATVTSKYSGNVFNNDTDEKHWSVGDWSKGWKDHNCRNDWWPYWHKKVKRRWGQRYYVYTSSKTKSVVNRETVQKYLTAVDSAAVAQSYKGGYYLIDPLMPGGWNKGVSFENYGNGGHKDRWLASYEDIYKNFAPRLAEYYKEMNKDMPADTFIYEPEIPGSYEARGCIDKINEPRCAKFKAYMETLQDTAFAQMLAYSKHGRKKYRAYFKFTPQRKKLFDRLDVDLLNLSYYYEAMNELRTKQNGCIDRAIAGFNDPDFDGKGKGLAEGGLNYYNAGENDYLGTQNDNKNYKKPTIKKSNKAPSTFKLAAYNMTHNSGALKDSVAKGSKGGGGSMGGAGDASLAARLKKMQEVNQKAVAKGVNLAEKAKEFEDGLAAAGVMSTGSGAASAARGGGSSPSAPGFGDSGKKATLDADDMGEATEADKTAALGAGANPGTAAGAQAGAGLGIGGIVGGYTSGEGSGSGEDAGAGAGAAQDPTGMSDEEKDIMAANYERNRSDYKTTEEDSLFEVLSKTYVRNLDKILTRKKKIHDSSSSSSP